jgi:Plasmid pRiA4b ORF-3-like protein
MKNELMVRPTRRTGATPAAHRNLIYALKISLRGVRPLVWRRVEIAADTKLPAVSRALIDAMGWLDYHLHSFEAGDRSYGVYDPEWDDDMIDESDVHLYEIAAGTGAQFEFTYDFGDDWKHRVVVERVTPPDPTVMYPRCIDGARACPPEDCGGVSGYADLLRILRQPRHAEHAQMQTWVGPRFDPEHFDLRERNEVIWRRAKKRR